MKLCPLKFSHSEGQTCAWWSTARTKEGCCAILAMADALDEMVLTGLPINNHF